MIRIIQPSEIEGFLKTREQRQQEASGAIRAAVGDILRAVLHEGDRAVLDCTRRFDGVDLEETGLRVPRESIEQAGASASAAFLYILRRAAGNIRRYHEKEKLRSWVDWEENGTLLGQRIIPLRRVGVYVPGGQAAYPSSLLMAVVPAQVACVEEIAVVTPPGGRGAVSPDILAAAWVLGIEEIYRIGGAQAVGALAFGTATIPKVDKIVGPGNAYVAEAKRRVFGRVGIDMVAGPSEVVVLADSSAEPGIVAADLLAQAEHDPLASSIAVMTDPDLGTGVQEALKAQIRALPRKKIIETSLADWGGLVVVGDIHRGIDLVNDLAPEHLGLHVHDPWSVLGRIRNAGAVFLGSFTPETAGDYWAGPNHILPTNRTARFASPLGTADFQKRSSLIQMPRTALEKDAGTIVAFAEKEGLHAHANAVRQRFR